MDDKEIKIDLKWFDDLLNKTNGTQLDFFDDLVDKQNLYSANSIGAATISQAASGNIWPYVLTGSSGTGTSLGNISGTGSYTLTNNGTGWDTWQVSQGSPGLHVRGDAEFEGDVKIKGKSIAEMFEKIEEKLAILHPNEELEAKWEKLRELRKQYIECEKDIIEKEKIWETLKK